jgi:hypothetical protein
MRALKTPAPIEIHELGRKMLSGELTEAEFAPHQGFTGWESRYVITSDYLWFVPTREWLDSLARLLRGQAVLEVCARRSFLKPLMESRGVDNWLVTGLEPQDSGVEKQDALEAALSRHYDVIFASWIDYKSLLDAELAELGKPIVLIGEGHGGCTGSSLLWEDYEVKLADSEYEWFKDVPQWMCINDHTWLVNWPKHLTSR